jgi:kexin
MGLWASKRRRQVKARWIREVLCLTVASLLLLSAPASPGILGDARADQTGGKVRTGLEGAPYVWYKAGKAETVWKSEDEVAAFFQAGAQVSEKRRQTLARVLEPGSIPLEGSNEFVMFVRMGKGVGAREAAERIRALKQHPEVKEVGPVFYRGKKDPSGRMALTGEIILRFDAGRTRDEVDDLADTYDITLLKEFDFSPNTYLFRSNSALESLKIANEIQRSGEVIYAYPNWFRAVNKRAIPNDSLFGSQWHLLNTGQGGGTFGEDVNIVQVWDTYKGSGNEVVSIVDEGLETGHEDLYANMLAGYHWDWVGDDGNPNPGNANENHATSVAGVAAARGFNALGVTGAGPESRLVGYRLLGANTDENEAEAMTRNKDVIDVSSNSWGPADIVQLAGPGPLMQAALENGATTGRGGKGVVYVFAGGNGGNTNSDPNVYPNDNSNFDGYANSRYTIAVAASTNLGRRSYYSEEGANIFVNAPSNGGTLGITTTDRTGHFGYSAGNYTSNFGGTSSAAPLVSGIISLMLQANPNLTWRDVQHILMTTAEKNDPTDPDWTTNGAGYHVNHKYGFGRIDAEAAVAAAETWVTAPPEEIGSGSATPNLPIPDNNTTGVSSNITIPDSLRVEYVDVFFTAADHTYWADLEVTLTSPSGTRSVLSSVGISYPSSYDNWRFGSARHFGESSQGTWTLTVKDLQSIDTGTFQSWGIKIYGTKQMNEVNLPLGPGWNLVSLPVRVGLIKAQEVLDSINASAGSTIATQISRWDNAAGTWESRIDGLPPGVQNFDLALGEGYFIKLAAAGTWRVVGAQPSSVVPLTIGAGWNLVSVPYSTTAYRAQDLINAINAQGGSVSQVSKWNNSAGVWESRINGLPLEIYNFDIVPGEGYFIRSASSSSFTP